jgi:hypothetical protein
MEEEGMMRGIRTGLTLLAAIGLVGATTAARSYAIGTTITVNTTENTIFNNGNCSLPEAVQAANTNAVVDACTAGVGNDTIAFNIGGGGAQTIMIVNPLTITAPAAIDGRTQPGYSSVPLITVTGATNNLIVLQSGSSGSYVRGLQLTIGSLVYSGEAGVQIESDSNHIETSYFNTDGTTSLGGADAVGVEIVNGAEYNIIGGADTSSRNLFGGHTGVDIMDGGANTIRFNYFGVRTDGVTALTGLPADAAAIGLCLAGAGGCMADIIQGNVITGYMYGIRLGSTAQYTEIEANYIGIGADGATKLGNEIGVWVYGSHNNTIGGMSGAERNVISGNYRNIKIEDDGANHADDNHIYGNYIGTTADGLNRTTPYSDNSSDYLGIVIAGGDGNDVGSSDTGKGNLISGNHYALVVEGTATNVVILGNMIGTDVTGGAALQQHGGILVTAVDSVSIGSAGVPGENVISGNDIAISISGTTGPTIYGNRIGLASRGNYAVGNGHGLSVFVGSATVAQNWLAYNKDHGIFISSDSTLNGGSTNNCFAGNPNDAVYSQNNTGSVPLTGNWWGSPTGPRHSGNPGGIGDAVSDYVDYSGFLTEPPDTCPRTLPDFDGDGHADAGYFRASTGVWGILRSAFEFDYGSPVYFSWGTTGDIAVSGDYDGDGKSDPTIRRPPAGGQSAAYMMLLSSMGYDFGHTFTVPAGWPGLGDTPVPGDYNGDGRTDPAIWRGNTGVWIIPLSPTFSSYQFFSWGASGDTPVGADVDGDGRTDVGYWRPSTGVWGFLRSSMGYSYASPLFFSWGTSGDIMVMADYDGDDLADPAVVIPPAGGQSRAYRILLSTLAYDAGSSVTVPAGWPGLGDTPVPADYDGDGKADPGIWRANTGIWIVPTSSSNYTSYGFLVWGASGDQIAK